MAEHWGLRLQTPLLPTAGGSAPDLPNSSPMNLAAPNRPAHNHLSINMLICTSYVALSFQWVWSRWTSWVKNRQTPSLKPVAKTRTLPFIHVPSLLAPIIEEIRNTCYTARRQNLCQNSLFY